MISKFIKGLEINEKDNLVTAGAKGMVEGTIDSAIVCLGIAGIAYLIGKQQKEVQEIQEEIAE